MSQVHAGDVVTVRRRAGRWIVGAPVNEFGQVRVFRDGGLSRVGLSAGVGDVMLIVRPTFTEGERVRFDGHSAIVVRDDGATVRVRFDASRDLQGGGRIAFRDQEADAARPDLVCENRRKMQP